MKLSPNVVAFLKNFSAINGGIYIEEGNVIQTVSLQDDCLATATVDMEFPISFGIYDLNEFLGVLSMHKEMPEVEFESHNMNIIGFSGRSKIVYRFTDKQMIHTPRAKTIKFEDADVQLVLTNDDYTWINNAAKVLKSTEIAFCSDGDKISLVAFDAKDDSRGTNSLTLDTPGNGMSYKMVYKTENFARLYPGDYDVEIIGATKIAKFKHKTLDLTYFMMFDPMSKFEG